MGLDPATAAYQQYGYNERLVEAQLGPHRLRIPANYFRDQIGPDFQGNFSLLVQWPDLEPLPPGQRSGQDMDTFDRQITIAPDYVDRVPIEIPLERMTAPIAESGSPGLDDPRERLDLMLPQPERDDPAHLRESMLTREALAMSPEQARREMAQLDTSWAQSRTAQPTQDAQRQPVGPQPA